MNKFPSKILPGLQYLSVLSSGKIIRIKKNCYFHLAQSRFEILQYLKVAILTINCFVKIRCVILGLFLCFHLTDALFRKTFKPQLQPSFSMDECTYIDSLQIEHPHLCLPI
ncbi:hypothetical protein ACOME3_002716 [Neoechinorhynchus agilis]